MTDKPLSEIQQAMLRQRAYDLRQFKKAVEKFVDALLELNKENMLTPSNILNKKKEIFGDLK